MVEAGPGTLNRELADILEHGAKQLGITLPRNAITSFELYYDLLAGRGQTFNLTAISGLEDVARLHFLDSIALLKAADFKDSRVIDIGSGAGFPGVPLKITEPSVDLTLLDSTGKRITFVSEVCHALNLEARCFLKRAEEAAFDPGLRESYDIAVSRAVARLNVLCEMCLPFVRVGGLLLAMKSADSAEEIHEAQSAVETLGAVHLESFDYLIPGTDIRHRAVIIRKVSQTPVKYPRRFARMQKAPL